MCQPLFVAPQKKAHVSIEVFSRRSGVEFSDDKEVFIPDNDAVALDAFRKIVEVKVFHD